MAIKVHADRLRLGDADLMTGRLWIKIVKSHDDRLRPLKSKGYTPKKGEKVVSSKMEGCCELFAAARRQRPYYIYVYKLIFKLSQFHDDMTFSSRAWG